MKKYKHLSQEQRYHIYALRKAGFSQKFIAQELQVSPSTICREIRRNKGLKGYRPQQAHRNACTRLRHQRKYNRRHGKDSGRGILTDRVPIEQRSTKANNRTEYGHWEADTVLRKKTKGAVLVTFVERKSRFLLTVKATSKSAESM